MGGVLPANRTYWTTGLARETPRSLTALGRRSLPEKIKVTGREYVLREVFKNDFFAITAMYEGEAGKVILKVHRQASFLYIPLGWVGRLLAVHEQACFERLVDVEGVPRFLERWGRSGVVREYIEGHAMRKGEHVPDDFHERLGNPIGAMHERGMAYVDLEKCENVLVGDDGHPHLFDFQISWYLPSRWGGELLAFRMVRECLQRADRYHLLKLHRRTRLDQLSPETVADSYRKPWHVRVFGALSNPWKRIRRVILNRIAPHRHGGERGRLDNEKQTVEVS